jgi:hypothetical protein
VTATAAAVLQERLGLDDDELCQALDADPLTLVAGDLDHKPQLPILLSLTEEAAASVHPQALRRWVRTRGPHGRPLDHLLTRDYAAFEDALEQLRERGFVITR